jgi:transcriptional regulator with XRE-family HTH domain
MSDNKFGNYLRELRLSRHPQVTQEQLAEAIGRSKMTISQFEIGKTAPPNGVLLEKIIIALCLSEDEKARLCFLAAQSRRQLPIDIEKYFFNHPVICDVIRAAMNNPVNVDWSKIKKIVGDSNEKDQRTNQL